MRQLRTETRLVGRTGEIERLLELALDPATGAALLTGPTGIGKSRLAEGVMIELTRRGWRSIGLSATDSAGQIPYAVLSQLIPDVLDRLDGLDARAADIAVLRAVEEAFAGPDPVVVAIDEMASFDEPACNVLVHLAKNRQLFIVATQPAGVGVSEALRRLTPAAVVEVGVEPLDLTGTAALAALLVDGPVDPGLVRELWARSHGYPLFVRELIATGLADDAIVERGGVHQLASQLALSANVGRQIVHRLGLVEGGERDVFELLALAGRLDVDDLAAVVGFELLEDLERRGLLRTMERDRRLRVAIAHPLHAEAVAADLTPLVRIRRHRELVAMLARPDATGSNDPVLLALARLGCGEPVDRDELVEAARVALRADRLRDAARLAGEAFENHPDEDTRTMLAETLTRQGRWGEADALLADPLPPDAPDWERMRRAIRRSSNHLWGFRDAEAAWRIDAECAPTIDDRDALDRLVAHQAWVALCRGDSATAIELTDPLADAEHSDVRFATATARAQAYVMVGRVDDGIELAQRAWDGRWGADAEYSSHGLHLISLGFGHLYAGNLDTVRFICGEAIRMCRERQEAPPLLFFLDLAGWTELMAGDLSHAISYFEEAQQIASDLAIALSVRASLAGVVIGSAQRGDPDRTNAAWHRILDVPPAPGPRADAEVGLAEAWRLVATGDPAKGAELMRTVAEQARGRGLRVVELLAMLDIARTGYATTQDAEHAERAGAACQGELLARVASTVAAAGRGDADRLLHDAEWFGGRGFALWAAELAAQASDRHAAGGEQRAATAAQRLSDRFRAGATDARTPTLARTQSIEPLTRREREIAGRAADGSTNADIAGQLHLSVRTVETHLQRVYRKLGVSSRAELSEVLDR